MIDERVLKSEERLVYELRSLYRRYGYLPYEMSKFEEYELYMRNKDFLLSDRIITFNDTDGRLLALKPDVTLSLIKNGEDVPLCKQKVYYNENVYRVSGSTERFKEIMQAGLECIGEIDLYDIYEVITLAAKSLSIVSDEFVLEVSHLGLLTYAIGEVCADEAFERQALECIAAKNRHDLERLCGKFGVADKINLVMPFVTEYADRKSVIAALENIFGAERVSELRALSEMLDCEEIGKKIRFDFSVVGAVKYYNGFVFSGFIGGSSGRVLSGGRYDNMMRKLGRSCGAIGFALYLDMIGSVSDRREQAFDVVVLYDEATQKSEVAAAVKKLVDEGKTVSAQRSMPDKPRFCEIVDLRGRKRC